MKKIYIYDPVTLQFLTEEVNPTSTPINSTHQPIIAVVGHPQYFVNGSWTFDNPNTPAVEYPVFQITNISISEAVLGGSIWTLDTKKTVALTAKTQLPEGQFTAIVEKIVNKQVSEDLRFRATITPLVDDPEGNLLTLPLYFETSGNYLIQAERLNVGLAGIGAPFRVAFASVDIDALVVIPT